MLSWCWTKIKLSILHQVNNLPLTYWQLIKIETSDSIISDLQFLLDFIMNKFTVLFSKRFIGECYLLNCGNSDWQFLLIGEIIMYWAILWIIRNWRLSGERQHFFTITILKLELIVNLLSKNASHLYFFGYLVFCRGLGQHSYQQVSYSLRRKNTRRTSVWLMRTVRVLLVRGIRGHIFTQSSLTSLSPAAYLQYIMWHTR